MRNGLVLLGAVVAVTACSKASSQGTTSASPAPLPSSATTSPPTPSGAPAQVGGPASASLAMVLAHPCSAFADADIEEALGTKNFAPWESPGGASGGDAECRWRIPKGGGFVQLIVHHPARTQAEFDRLAHALKREPFAGVGDAAYVDPDYKWGHIDVMKNGQDFKIQVSRGNVITGATAKLTTMRDAAVTLARMFQNKL
jgi:Protein of unknown function (DUF3558)